MAPKIMPTSPDDELTSAEAEEKINMACNALASVEDHWWCKETAHAACLLPMISSSDEGGRSLREFTGAQLTTCVNCCESYHREVRSFVARYDKTELEDWNESAGEWGAQRVLSRIASVVQSPLTPTSGTFAATVPSNVADIVRDTFVVVFEVLLDSRLALRMDVAKAVEALHANVDSCAALLLDPLRHRITKSSYLFPGLVALCLWKHEVLSQWALRVVKDVDCVRSVDADDAVASTSLVFRAVLDRLVDAQRGALVHSPTSGTPQATNSALPDHVTLWYRLNRLVLMSNSPALCRLLLQTEPKLPQLVLSAVQDWGDSDPDIVEEAVELLVTLLRVLGDEFWSMASDVDFGVATDILADRFVEQTSSDSLRWKLAMALAAIAARVRNVRNDTVMSTAVHIVSRCLPILTKAANLPPLDDCAQIASPDVYARGSAKSGTPEEDLVCASRNAYAEVLLLGFAKVPDFVSSVWHNDVTAVLLLFQNSEDSDNVETARELLRLVIVNDMRTLLCAHVGALHDAILVLQALNATNPYSFMRENGQRPRQREPPLFLQTPAMCKTFKWSLEVWKAMRYGHLDKLLTPADDSGVEANGFSIVLEAHRYLGLLNLGDGSWDRGCNHPLPKRGHRLVGDLRGLNVQRRGTGVFSEALDEAADRIVVVVERFLSRLSERSSIGAQLTKVLLVSAGHCLSSRNKRIRVRYSKLLPILQEQCAGRDEADEVALGTLVKPPSAQAMFDTGFAATVTFLHAVGTDHAARGTLHMLSVLRSISVAEKPFDAFSFPSFPRPSLGGVVTMLLNSWSTSNEDQRDKFMGEVTNRSLDILRDLWQEAFPDTESSREGLCALLRMGLTDLRRIAPNWSLLAIKVATRTGIDETHTEIMKKVFDGSFPRSSRLSPEDLDCIAEHFHVPRTEHSNDAARRILAHRSQHAAALNIFTRKLPIGPAIQTQGAAARNKEVAPRLREIPQPKFPPSNRDSSRTADTQPKQGLIAELKASGRSGGAAKPRVPQRVPPKKGPTKLEEMRQRYKEQKELEKAACAASGSADARSGRTPLDATGSVGNVTSQDTRRYAGRAQRSVAALDSQKPKESAEDLAAAEKKRRRRLRRRSVEELQATFLALTPASISDASLDAVPPLPASFEDAEHYVACWEKLLFENFRSEVMQRLEEEADFASRAPRDANVGESLFPCRTPFETTTQLEPSGVCKLMGLRFAGSGSLRDRLSNSSRANARGGGFCASEVGPGDVIRVQLARAAHGYEFEDPSASVLLGVVSQVEHERGVTILKVRVRFPLEVSLPGQNRAVAVSKLASFVTLSRQLDALFNVTKLSDAGLLALLNPRLLWQEHRSFDKEMRDKGAVRPSQRLRETVDAISKDRMNPSQHRAIRAICAAGERVSRRPSDPMESPITILQGPPGTGKTSTILSILSATLSELLCSRKSSHSSRRGESTSPTPRLSKHSVRAGKALFNLPVVSRRVLVCAASNTAVDEVLLRVIERGLRTTEGSTVTPRVVRIGGGSKNDAVQPLTLSELVSVRLNARKSVDAKRSGSSAPDAYDKLRGVRNSLREVSARIGEVDAKRKALRQERAVLRKSLDPGAGEDDSEGETPHDREMRFDEEDRSLTTTLTKLHGEKGDIVKRLAEAETMRERFEQEKERDRVEAAAEVLNSASIVFATLGAAGHEVMSYISEPFDLVIVDEAAQATEPECLIPIVGPATRQGLPARQVVLIGDAKQLPPTVLATDKAIANALGRSMLERVQEPGNSKVFMLNRQYRMHPAISQFPRRRFYNSKLLNGPSVKALEYHRPYHFDRQSRFGPLTLLNTTRYSRASDTRSRSGSYSNPGEAEVVRCAILSIVRLYPMRQAPDMKSIAVLAPYNGQVNEIRRTLANDSVLREMDIEVSTVDGIQGREKDIVILSTTRAGSGGIGFVKDTRRMNVAITRARFALLVVGNMSTLSQGSPDWRAFIEHAEEHKRVVSVRDPRETFPEAFARRVQPPPPMPSASELPTYSDSDIEDELASDTTDESGGPTQPIIVDGMAVDWSADQADVGAESAEAEVSEVLADPVDRTRKAGATAEAEQRASTRISKEKDEGYRTSAVQGAGDTREGVSRHSSRRTAVRSSRADNSKDARNSEEDGSSSTSSASHVERSRVRKRHRELGTGPSTKRVRTSEQDDTDPKSRRRSVAEERTAPRMRAAHVRRTDSERPDLASSSNVGPSTRDQGRSRMREASDQWRRSPESSRVIKTGARSAAVADSHSRSRASTRSATEDDYKAPSTSRRQEGAKAVRTDRTGSGSRQKVGDGYGGVKRHDPFALSSDDDTQSGQDTFSRKHSTAARATAASTRDERREEDRRRVLKRSHAHMSTGVSCPERPEKRAAVSRATTQKLDPVAGTSSAVGKDISPPRSGWLDRSYEEVDLPAPPRRPVHRPPVPSVQNGREDLSRARGGSAPYNPYAAKSAMLLSARSDPERNRGLQDARTNTQPNQTAHRPRAQRAPKVVPKKETKKQGGAASFSLMDSAAALEQTNKSLRKLL